MLLAAALLLLAAASPKDIEDRLQPPVQLEGQPPVKYKLADRMKVHKVTAVSVAVIHAGKIEWAQAWGTLEDGGTRAADANTMFQAASISKPVAALAALRMVEQGDFKLDDDVNSVLKTWKVPHFDFPGTITLREIVSHSAGFTVHGFRGYAEGEPVPTVSQILDGAKPANSAPVRVDVAPGSIWRYSGGGFTVMQQMLIDKSGMAFPELMRRQVIDRIGMTRSAYSQPLAAQYQDNAARGYRAAGTMVKGRWHTYPELAAAGLWTTPTDLSKFLIEIWNASRGDSTRIISKAMAQQMLTRQKDDYGLGVGIEGKGSALHFGHGGANEGYRCNMQMFIESGDGIAVMTNNDAGSALASEILRAAADAYGWPAFRPEVKKPLTLPAAKLKRLEGKYELDKMPIRVSVSGAGISVTSPMNAATAEFLAESETEFFPLTDGLPKLKFVLEPDGTVDQFEVFGTRATRVR